MSRPGARLIPRGSNRSPSSSASRKKNPHRSSDRPAAESSKFQAPSSREIPSTKFQTPRQCLELDVWSFSGAWCLVLGAWSLKPKHDLPGSFVLGRMSNGRFRFLQRIHPFHFRPQQSAFPHFKERRKSFGALLSRRGFVPFVYPKSGKPQVLENEHAVWNAERLQTHRAIRHHCSVRCQAFRDAQSVLATNRIQPQSNWRFASRASHFI